MFSMIPNLLCWTYDKFMPPFSLNKKQKKKFSHFTNLEGGKEACTLLQRFTVSFKAKNSLHRHQTVTNKFQKRSRCWNPDTPVNIEGPHVASKVYCCVTNSLHRCWSIIYVIRSKKFEWPAKFGAYCRLLNTLTHWLDNPLHLSNLMAGWIKQLGSCRCTKLYLKTKVIFGSNLLNCTYQS